MAPRLSLVLMSAFLIMQIFTWQSQATVVRRDAPAPAPADQKNASQTIDEAIQSFKSGLDDLAKKIQSNELYRNVSEALEQFGHTVQQQGQQLVDKIKSDGDRPGH